MFGLFRNRRLIIKDESPLERSANSNNRKYKNRMRPGMAHKTDRQVISEMLDRRDEFMQRQDEYRDDMVESSLNKLMWWGLYVLICFCVVGYMKITDTTFFEMISNIFNFIWNYING